MTRPDEVSPRQQNPSARPVRLKDIAEAAAVSVSVVSRVLAGRGDVAPATRARVSAVAQGLGYRAQVERRGRPARRNQLIDLALAEFDNPWADEVTAGAWHAAARLGYDLILTVERDVPTDDWPERIMAHGSVGVIVGLIHPTTSQLATLQEAGTPIVLLEERARGATAATSIGTTNRQGGFDAARILIESGVDELIVLVGTPRYAFGRERIAGFMQAVATLAPQIAVRTVATTWSSSAAEAAMRRVLRAPTGRLGVFACNDDFAFGVYRACASTHRDIPGDVAVVGFDDVPESTTLSPPLTTIHQPLRRMAQVAVELITSSQAGHPLPGRRIELPSHPVLRGSALPRLHDLSDRG
jgi:DNA-binding LacI/PurR family transcriptional regulator